MKCFIFQYLLATRTVTTLDLHRKFQPRGANHVGQVCHGDPIEERFLCLLLSIHDSLMSISTISPRLSVYDCLLPIAYRHMFLQLCLAELLRS